MSKAFAASYGAVYDDDSLVQFIHQERYDIVMTLISQRKHSLVAFNWRHEKDALVELANKEGISYEVIDGTVPAERRKDIVQRFRLVRYVRYFATHNQHHTDLLLLRQPLLYGVRPLITQNIFNNLISVYIDLDKQKRLKLFLYKPRKLGSLRCIRN